MSVKVYNTEFELEIEKLNKVVKYNTVLKNLSQGELWSKKNCYLSL